MSLSFTPKLGLPIIPKSYRNYHLLINPVWSMLEGLGALGPLSVITNEIPVSSSLFVAIAAGTFRASNGSDVIYAGGTVAVTASTTTKVWLDEAATIQTGSSYPSGPILKLASVTAATSTITSIVDDRRYLAVTGGLPRRPVRTVTATTDTPTIADGLILADATAAAIAFTLPTLTTAQAGLPLTIVKVDAAAHNVTVATASGATITLTTRYDKTNVVWSGTEWLAL